MSNCDPHHCQGFSSCPSLTLNLLGLVFAAPGESLLELGPALEVEVLQGLELGLRWLPSLVTGITELCRLIGDAAWRSISRQLFLEACSQLKELIPTGQSSCGLGFVVK